MTQRHWLPFLAAYALVCAGCGDEGKQVTPPAATRITLNTASATLVEGDSVRLTWTLTGFQGSPDVSLTSSDSEIASVAASGWVRAVAPGSARVVARAGDAADTVQVQVSQRAVALAFLGMPDTAAAGSDDVVVQVRVADVRDDGVAGLGVLLTPLYPGGQQATTTTADSGVAEFALPAPTQAGEYLLEAMLADSAGAAPDTATLVVVAAEAAALAIGGDDPLTLQVGDTVRLTTSHTDAFGNPAPATPITWVSSDEQVAVVAAGLVEATGAGTAGILAISGVLRDSVRVQVTLPPPSTAIIAPPSASFEALLDTVQFSLTLTTPQGDTITGQPVSWSVLDAAVASVDDEGRVVALAQGATRVVGSSGSLSDTADVSVAQVAAAVVAAPSSITLDAIGATAQLAATVRDANDQTIVGAAATWSSLDEAVATVDASGVVTAVTDGGAQVVVTAGAFADTATVTVAQVATTVALTAPTDTIRLEGETRQITAAYADANGFTVPGIVTTWSSSADSIASVDATGLVTAGAVNGTAWIRASGGGVLDSARIVVRDVAFVLTTALNSDTVFNVQVGMYGGVPATAYIYSESGDLLARRTGPTISYAFPAHLDGTVKRVEIKADRAQVQAIEAAQDSLVGEFPEGILDLPNLAVLNLAINRGLTGPLPAAFGSLTSLVAVELFSTGLSGPLPASFGDLVALDILNLSDTQLGGSASVLESLTTLWYLDLGESAFAGGMPDLSVYPDLIEVHMDAADLNAYSGGLDVLTLVNTVNFADAGLDQADVDQVLADLEASVAAVPRAGTVDLGGSNAAPGPSGLASAGALQAAGWTVITVP